MDKILSVLRLSIATIAVYATSQLMFNPKVMVPFLQRAAKYYGASENELEQLDKMNQWWPPYPNPLISFAFVSLIEYFLRKFVDPESWYDAITRGSWPLSALLAALVIPTSLLSEIHPMVVICYVLYVFLTPFIVTTILQMGKSKQEKREKIE